MGFHLDEVPRIVKFTETESRMVGARGWGVSVSGGRGRVSVFLQDEKVLEVDGGVSDAAMRTCSMPPNCTLENDHDGPFAVASS